jgi:hypothetical protein
MQDSLAAEDLGREVTILGVNVIGAESGIPGMCFERDLPLLQDTAEKKVWEAWAVVYRDVVVLGAENQKMAVYNLTTHDLGSPANFDSLRSLLRQAAGTGR